MITQLETKDGQELLTESWPMPNGAYDAAPVAPSPELPWQEVVVSSDPSGDSAPQQSYLHVLLKDQLERRGMSIRDLAKACGATPTVVSRWVSADPRRRVVPESRGCVQLARALDLPVVEVLVAAGRIPPPDGRPPHPHEAEIKRVTLALDLALRRLPTRAFPITLRVVSAFVTSLFQVGNEATVDEMAGEPE